MPRGSVALKRMNGRLVSSKSKTGDPECSAAMSAKVNARHGNPVAMALDIANKILGRCRAKARMLKMGGLHAAAGNEAKAQTMQARAARGLSQSQRLAMAKQKAGARRARISSTRMNPPAAAASSSPPRATAREQVAAHRAATGWDNPQQRSDLAARRRAERVPMARGRIFAGNARKGDYVRGHTPANFPGRPVQKTEGLVVSANKDSLTLERPDGKRFSMWRADARALGGNTPRRFTPERSAKAAALVADRKANRVAPTGDKFESHVHQAAAAVPQAKLWGGNAAFIHHVHEEHQKIPGAQKMSLDQFKARLAVHDRIRAHMSRADMVSAMNPHDVKASHTELKLGGVSAASWNFIRPKGAPAFSLGRESTRGKAAPWKATDRGKSHTGFMFDMKKGDIKGQTTLMDKYGTVHTRDTTASARIVPGKGDVISRQSSNFDKMPKGKAESRLDRGGKPKWEHYFAKRGRLERKYKELRAGSIGPRNPEKALKPAKAFTGPHAVPTGPARHTFLNSSSQVRPIVTPGRKLPAIRLGNPTPAGPATNIRNAHERQKANFGASLWGRTGGIRKATQTPTPAAPPQAQPVGKAEQALARGRQAIEHRAQLAKKLQALRAVKNEHAHPTEHGQPGKVYEMKSKDIHFDPERFQYKLEARGQHGTTEALKDVKKFDPELAGTISVWRDPANGKTYVVNGHHRLDLAHKHGIDKIHIKYLDAPNAETARAKGAMVNIAEGRGTSIDAAKFFRDTGITKEHAQASGLSLREHTANQGLAMTSLEPRIFKRVVNGEITPNRAAIVGGAGLSHEQQHALLKVLDKPQNRKLTDGTVKNLADSAREAGSRKVQTRDLFGTNEQEEALFVHRAKVEDGIKRALAGDKRLFSLVSKSKAAQALEERGRSSIDVAETGKVGAEAASVLGVFDQLKHTNPHISRPLTEAAERIAKGENPKTVEAGTRKRVSGYIKDVLEGRVSPFAA
jgi:hypothetical protein